MAKSEPKPRLLVVEDEPALARVLQMRLQIEGMAQLRQLGVDAIFTKPYDGKELSAQIRGLLGS